MFNVLCAAFIAMLLLALLMPTIALAGLFIMAAFCTWVFMAMIA